MKRKGRGEGVRRGDAAQLLALDLHAEAFLHASSLQSMLPFILLSIPSSQISGWQMGAVAQEGSRQSMSPF